MVLSYLNNESIPLDEIYGINRGGDKTNPYQIIFEMNDGSKKAWILKSRAEEDFLIYYIERYFNFEYTFVSIPDFDDIKEMYKNFIF